MYWLMSHLCVLFFFSSRRRHTRCGRDWSSDVCSSDLLNLDTHFGPSWKPLPVALTTIFALVPGAAPALWVAVARAGALAAIALGFRGARRRGGGVAGGLVAAVAILVSTAFLRFAAVGDSEGVLVAL